MAVMKGGLVRVVVIGRKGTQIREMMSPALDEFIGDIKSRAVDLYIGEQDPLAENFAGTIFMEMSKESPVLMRGASYDVIKMQTFNVVRIRLEDRGDIRASTGDHAKAAKMFG